MSDFHSTVLAEVRRRGAVSFAEFMGWALYHPQHGYYTTALRAGRRGDFVTGPHTGPLYGRLLAEVFISLWDRLGSARYTVVELGGSDGTLAESVLRALEEAGRGNRVAYYMVESSPAAMAAARRRLSRFRGVRLYADLDDVEHTAGVEGCVISNEFFDALPFHRVVRMDGVWRELFVVEDNGRLVERPGDLSTPRLLDLLNAAGIALDDGFKAEVCPRMNEVVDAVGRLLARGVVLTVDYGAGAAELYSPERPRGTRRTYFHQSVGDDPFLNIGSRDITAHVDFTSLAREGGRWDLAPVYFSSLGSFLLSAGERVLKTAVESASERDRPGLVRQIQTLVHPRGLGGAFQVLAQTKHMADFPWAGAPANRLKRLGLLTH